MSAFKPHRMALTTWALLGCAAAAQAQPATPNNLDEPISRLLPLQEGDVPTMALLSPTFNPRSCAVNVFSESGALLIAIEEAASVIARFVDVPATDSTTAVPARLTRLTVMERKASGWGGYTVGIWGKPNNEPRWGSNAYQLNLKVADKRSCPNEAGPDCFVYEGTLEQVYRFAPESDPKRTTVSAPQQRITLRENCPASRYTYYGLFKVPGFLDYLGGFLLGGNR